MALFPAYGLNEEESARTETSEGLVWLENSSFKADVNVLKKSETLQADDEREDKVSLHRKKQKKKEKKNKKNKAKETIQLLDDALPNDLFLIDKKRNKEYLSSSVQRIARPSAPKYILRYKSHQMSNKNYKKKIVRYFHHVCDELHKIANDKSNSSENVEFEGYKEEQDLTQTTAFYNRSLSDNPHDINMWLKYVRFQDIVNHFEKAYRKGSIAKGSRVLAERKLIILDKALIQNPNCEALLRERLNIAASVFPADELYLQMEKLIEKEPQNIILWQGYIESLQCSMSHCNISAVLKLYAKCLSTLHHLRRNSLVEKTVLEENILRMLYQCGLFLKQSGLFEQLWLLLSLYLELNLSPEDKGKFNISSNINEKELEELENAVLSSQLPIHELWLRIEKLRESCHWLPSKDENCEDPQRIVFAEDVSEFIHPITMPGNTFKLTAIVLTLLKVPLLPCRHSTIQELGLDYVPWSLDSIEMLLPLFYPMYGVNFKNKYLLKDTQKLAIGPQYSRTLPGQEEYLEFVLNVMRNCMDCLKEYEKVAMALWWFRLQRLLIILDKEGRFKMTHGFRKRIKNAIKNFIKKEVNRNNLLFYQEYALFESEWGTNDDAIGILLTALSSKNNDHLLDSIQDTEEQRHVCRLYRTIIELTLSNEKEPEHVNKVVLDYLVHMCLGKSANSLSETDISDAAIKLKHAYLQLLQKVQMQEEGNFGIIDHFLPNFFIDIVICYSWFIYFKEGIVNCGAFLEETLSTLEKSGSNLWLREVLFEFYAAILYRHLLLHLGSVNFKLLEELLQRGIESYPNNLFLLAAFSKVQSLNCCIGQPLFKTSKILLNTGRALSSIILVLITQQKIAEIEASCTNTFTGQSPILEDIYKNKMLSIFKRLTLSSMCTRRCGLVWRLYLQFLYSHFTPDLVRNAYYAAVEECPWLKVRFHFFR
ncbi:protein NRDE2 homolog [Agrilus planipennis]|uniref:Protein NRDE2 homolog n=1 Tax=Agrilus planipennis TaxID=224129 RepID=A0A1W4WIN1_AGRPL|nr:protein NRDE2 homolog [Agrilus planipennis]